MGSAEVVVTGLAVTTTLGTQLEPFWQAIKHATPGTGPLAHFDPTIIGDRHGGELTELRDERRATNSREPLAVDLAHRTLAAAARDARLFEAGVDLQRVGICFGSVMGTRPTLEPWLMSEGAEASAREQGWLESETLVRAPAARLGLGGPNLVVSTACASGNSAIALATQALRDGQADAMFAGGVDELSHAMQLMFESFRALTCERIRPFDLNRTGLLLAEGAAVLVLERAHDAQARRARIYGRVAGTANAADAHHMTAPHPAGEGAASAMRTALNHAGADASEVDYVCAHGTGTRSNDKSETRAIHSALGRHAAHTPVSSIKGTLGHTQGAAGAVEAVCCLLAIRDAQIPPTANWETADPDCELDIVAGKPRARPIKLCLNNAFGFGGNNECIAFAAA